MVVKGREERTDPCESCGEETPWPDGVEHPRLGWLCVPCFERTEERERDAYLEMKEDQRRDSE